MAAPGRCDTDSPVRQQLSALRSLLVLAMLLTQQDSQAAILDVVANAVESLGRFQLAGIYFDGLWQDVRVRGRGAAAEGPPGTAVITAVLPPGGGQVELADLPWGWAYPLASPYGPGGYLVVGAAGPLAEVSVSCCRCWRSRPRSRWPTRTCTAGNVNGPGSSRSLTWPCGGAWRSTTG